MQILTWLLNGNHRFGTVRPTCIEKFSLNGKIYRGSNSAIFIFCAHRGQIFKEKNFLVQEKTLSFKNKSRYGRRSSSKKANTMTQKSSPFGKSMEKSPFILKVMVPNYVFLFYFKIFVILHLTVGWMAAFAADPDRIHSAATDCSDTLGKGLYSDMQRVDTGRNVESMSKCFINLFWHKTSIFEITSVYCMATT